MLALFRCIFNLQSIAHMQRNCIYIHIRIRIHNCAHHSLHEFPWCVKLIHTQLISISFFVWWIYEEINIGFGRESVAIRNDGVYCAFGLVWFGFMRRCAYRKYTIHCIALHCIAVSCCCSVCVRTVSGTIWSMQLIMNNASMFHLRCFDVLCCTLCVCTYAFSILCTAYYQLLFRLILGLPLSKYTPTHTHREKLLLVKAIHFIWWLTAIHCRPLYAFSVSSSIA